MLLLFSSWSALPAPFLLGCTPWIAIHHLPIPSSEGRGRGRGAKSGASRPAAKSGAVAAASRTFGGGVGKNVTTKAVKKFKIGGVKKFGGAMGTNKCALCSKTVRFKRRAGVAVASFACLEVAQGKGKPPRWLFPPPPCFKIGCLSPFLSSRPRRSTRWRRSPPADRTGTRLASSAPSMHRCLCYPSPNHRLVLIPPARVSPPPSP